MSRYIVMMVIAILFVGVYTYWRVGRSLTFFGKKVRKWPVRIARIIIAGVLTVLSANFLSNAAMVVLHFIIAFMVVDVLSVVASRIWKNKEAKLYKCMRFLHQSGILAGMAALALIIYGFINMTSIVETVYTVTTDKQIEDCRVIFISDTHYDTIQSTSLVKDMVERINGQNADIVILGGDIVEEGTSKEKVEEVFELFGGIKSQYGVYYVYGNHDTQPYTKDKTFSAKELETIIRSNGITILEDEFAYIGRDIVLAGRSAADFSNTLKREAPADILADANKDKYVIMADHQPIEWNDNIRAGVDLQVSGHTHAGQIWPVGIINELTGYNYGLYEQEGSKLIVSSGVAGWRYKIRTGGHCEYVRIDIKTAE